MTKRKVKRCLLLERYGYPHDLSDKLINDWYKELCLCCPLVDACVFDWKGEIPAIIKEKLGSKIIPCPHCEARDKWQIKTEEGLSCLHCGAVIHKYKPIRRRPNEKRQEANE